MSDKILYFPVLPDPTLKGSERADDVRQWVEGLLIPSGKATTDEDKANAYLVVGGDGSFMRTIRKKHDKGKIFIGVNRGTLGFLLNPIDDINDIPTNFDQISRISVTLIQVVFTDTDGKEHEFLAFNDTFCGGDIADYITFNISGSLDHFPTRKVEGNGIIVSTPQGTTGFSLKARGTAAVLPLDTKNWFIAGVATGPYPCDQVTPQKITIEVSSRQPVHGYADGHDQRVDHVQKLVVTPTDKTVDLGFISRVDFASRRTSLAQLVERGE